MASIILVLIYTALSALAGFCTDLCLHRWKRTAHKAAGLRRIWLPAYILLSLLPVFGAFLPDSGAKFALQGAGNIWLGFYIYYGWILVTLLVCMQILCVLSRGRTGKGYGAALSVSLCVTVCLVGYGLHHAQQTAVKRFDLSVEKSAGGLQEMKLVLIGDLHLGVNSRLATTERMVELINAEEPDAVVIAGDIFTSSYGGLRQPEAYAEALRGIRTKYGVFAVYGNHDVEETLFGGFPISPLENAFRTAQMEAFFDACGFTTLADETVLLGGSVQLSGRIDGERAGDGTKNRMTAAELLKDCEKSLPVLVLEHEPKDFHALEEAGADTVLCGHTHNGQIFPGNLIIPFFNENAYGLVRVGRMDTLVTAGVGYYGPPMRIGTDSEVTVVTLHFE
ncbi:MAG: metallophosphoesterase [Clostridia bacterium]|nr:metallophosphoesterase [Clostridia bacterium]